MKAQTQRNAVAEARTLVVRAGALARAVRRGGARRDARARSSSRGA